MMDLVEALKLGTECLPQESPQKERRRNGGDFASITNVPEWVSSKQKQVAEA